jgi:sortase A
MLDAAEAVAYDDTAAERRRRLTYVIGEIVFTIGLLLLLFVAYELHVKPWLTDRAQDGLNQELDRQWAKGGALVPGQPVARLHIPRLHRRWAVVDGVTQADLAKGPGRYPRSDDPGEVGNLAIAGHRLPSTFWDLDRLRTGDPVVVETRSGWFVYRVTRVWVVRPWQVEVIKHNPADPKVRPTRRLLTLTTCHPKFNNYERLIVQAELSREEGRRAGRPPELGPPRRA